MLKALKPGWLLVLMAGLLLLSCDGFGSKDDDDDKVADGPPGRPEFVGWDNSAFWPSLWNPSVGDSIEAIEALTVYSSTDTTGGVEGTVQAGDVGVMVRGPRFRNGVTWADTDWANSLSGFVDYEKIQIKDDDDPPGCEPNCDPPDPGELVDIVIIGCSNTDNWLNHGAGGALNLNPGGGQSGKTIVSYGEKTEKKKVWNKFKADIGPETDLAIYMLCQRYGPGLMAARQQDVAHSLEAGQSGSDLYSEKDLVKNILGEMRFILDGDGLSHVPVAALPMHFYEPDGGNTNPCDRIGSNGILAQENYVDEIYTEGAFSSLLRPSQTFSPLQLVDENGQPWRMPSVSQNGDVTSDNCHLTSGYVVNTLMPAFQTMLAGMEGASQPWRYPDVSYDSNLEY